MVNYGRGTSPILPLNIECIGDEETLSNCSKINNLHLGQCTQVIGVDCTGMYIYTCIIAVEQYITILFCS